MLLRIGITLRKIFLVLLFCFAAALSANTLTYLNFDPAYGFLRLKQYAVATGWYLPAYYAHIFAGGIILVVGFIQFSETVRRRWRHFHRFCGYIYVFGILCLAGPGGFIMSLFIDRGPFVLSSFVIQCGLWMYFTYSGFNAIRQGRRLEHERWLIRSFSLTLAAVTLRLYIFAGSYYFDLAQPLAYGTFAWLSWLPNLLVAETFIRKKLHARPEAVGRL